MQKPIARTVKIIGGDCRKVLAQLPDKSINCCVTSPPYFGLRDYGVQEQIGLEPTPDQYVDELVKVFREVKRVLRDDGTLWLNLGDSYAGSGKGGGNGHDKQSTNKGSLVGHNAGKTYAIGETARQAALTNTTRMSAIKPWREGSARADGKLKGDGKSRRNRDGVGPVDYCKAKDLIGIPWMVAFALRADGWYLRQDIIWHKPNPMPESMTDRCTKAHEYIFLLSKSRSYYFDADVIAEPSVYAPNTTSEVEREKGYYSGKWSEPSKGLRNDGSFKAIRETRNKRSVWTVMAQPTKEAHFATFPPKLVEPCVLAGCPEGGTVLDPFAGSGVVGAVAYEHGRNAVLIDLNPDYVQIAERRKRKHPDFLFER